MVDVWLVQEAEMGSWLRKFGEEVSESFPNNLRRLNVKWFSGRMEEELLVFVR